MSTSWTLTRNKICEKALQKVGTLARGQTADQDDLQIVIDALDGLLKTLPLYGYSWPQIISGQAVLLLLANTQATTLPSDYYGGALVTLLDTAGNERPLRLATLTEWNRITRRADTGAYPTVGYIDPYNVLRTWPVQNVNVQARIVYQKAMTDTVNNAATALESSWMIGLVQGLAWAIGDEFGASEQQMARWLDTWRESRTVNVMARSYPAPAYISVCD